MGVYLDLICAMQDAADAAIRIHCLERSAYAAVLRAVHAKSDFLSRASDDRLTELRNELKISDTEHREYLLKVSSNEQMKFLRAGLCKENICNTEVTEDSLDLACVIPDATFQIHCLERSAYASVLRAFYSQSDLLSRAMLLAKLRNELRISDIEHGEVLVSVSSNDYIKSLRKFTLANYFGQEKMIPAFDANAVVPNKTVKIGQASDSSLNCHNLAQISPIPAYAMLSSRSMSTLSTSNSTKKGPYLDLHAALPAKRLKSGNGHALAYLKCSPYAEQLPATISDFLVKSSIDVPVYRRTSLSEVSGVHVLLSVDQSSRNKETEVPPTSNRRVLISSAGNVNHDSDIIKLRVTSSLLNKVEKLFREKPDPANLETAKSMLKDQEKCLLEALINLSEVLYAAAHPGSNCQPAEFNQHGEGEEMWSTSASCSDKEAPPVSVGSSDGMG